MSVHGILIANGKIDILSWKFSLMHSTRCGIQIHSSSAQRKIIFSLASGSVSHSMKKNIMKKKSKEDFSGQQHWITQVRLYCHNKQLSFINDLNKFSLSVHIKFDTSWKGAFLYLLRTRVYVLWNLTMRPPSSLY